EPVEIGSKSLLGHTLDVPGDDLLALKLSGEHLQELEERLVTPCRAHYVEGIGTLGIDRSPVVGESIRPLPEHVRILEARSEIVLDDLTVPFFDVLLIGLLALGLLEEQSRGILCEALNEPVVPEIGVAYERAPPLMGDFVGDQDVGELGQISAACFVFDIA